MLAIYVLFFGINFTSAEGNPFIYSAISLLDRETDDYITRLFCIELLTNRDYPSKVHISQRSLSLVHILFFLFRFTARRSRR